MKYNIVTNISLRNDEKLCPRKTPRSKYFLRVHQIYSKESAKHGCQPSNKSLLRGGLFPLYIIDMSLRMKR